MLSNTIGQQTVRWPAQWQFGSGVWRSLAVMGLLFILWSGYALTGQPVTLVINGQPRQIRTHRLTVEAVLQELDLTLAAEDAIQPPPGTPLAPDQLITIRLARPVSIEADGQTVHLRTHQQTAAAILAEAGISAGPRDEILINGTVVAHPEMPLALPPAPDPAAQNATGRLFAAGTPRGAVIAARPQPVRLIVRRAIPVTLDDNGIGNTFYTTRPNVGEALLEQGLTLFLGDEVTPGLGTRLSPGMRIYIQRSIPVDIVVDGRMIKTRTRRETVGGVLAQAGVALMGQDFSRPPADQLISSGDTIEVVRVRETLEIEQKVIPFETIWAPDPEMELDQQEVRQTGAGGVIKSRTRVRYENDREVARVLEDEWLDQEPRNREIAYGTKIVVRTLQTEHGPIEYWRKISMLATPYTAATSGKDPDHPRYGITRSGLPVRFGMAAVDPKVIPLMTNLYVAGYGPALAADTGGLVQGKRIDLAYEIGQLPGSLYEWRDVYVLTPVPPPDEIRYVLPQWPQR